ncbi:MAG: hypothetical protein IJ506_03095 [Clostridia bacterium]|nr:hypothetical protein [Clostridia bacterium]
MKKITAYETALAALACAFATIMLTIGIYSEILLLTGYLFSGIALMLPLAKKSYRGYILAYLATSLLSLLFSLARFFDILPFIVFFGLHPLVNELQLKYKVNRWVAGFVKAAWFDGAMYLIWKFVFDMTTSIAFVDKYFLPILLIAGTAFFFFYDYLTYKCRYTVNVVVNRLIKK